MMPLNPDKTLLVLGMVFLAVAGFVGGFFVARKDEIIGVVTNRDKISAGAELAGSAQRFWNEVTGKR